MEKIISLFQRNYETDHLVRNEVVLGAEWVLEGLGVATRKWDGSCCMINGTGFYKRYDAKHGKKPPPGFIAAQDPDPLTGHWPGWVPINPVNPADQYFMEGWANSISGQHGDGGTFELVGPKINGNPEGLEKHFLKRHGDENYWNIPRHFEGLRDWLKGQDIEGIVFHHPDGIRKVKIKKKDFGLPRKPNVK